MILQRYVARNVGGVLLHSAHEPSYTVSQATLRETKVM